VKAIILCAGQGTRLLPHTEFVPKTLVPVCGRPILDYQLEALRGRVERIVLVAGYLQEKLDEHLASADRPDIELISNEDYDKTNSMYSLWLARNHVEGEEFLLLNGDVLFDARALEQVLDHPAPTGLLIDDQADLIEGEMNVVVRDGLVTAIGKEIPVSQATAQSLQIVKFGPTDCRLLFERVEQLVSAGQRRHFPPFAYRAIFEQSRMVAIPRRGGTWWEIDTLDDLARCEEALATANAVSYERSAGRSSRRLVSRRSRVSAVSWPAPRGSNRSSRQVDPCAA
jgi:L-glutamine-phosphate cytidylyltransferase